MNETNGSIIELRNVTKTFSDGFTAVKGLDLAIKKGEFVTFLGPSGCGKTTTLRMIAGFDLPTEGEILLNGKDISHLPPNMRPVNTVFQRYALFPHMNVYENIAFGLKQKKLPKNAIDKKVENVLDLVDLEGFEKRRISTLSGGQQQRIAIARALVNEPQILLLDEPLGALDLKMRKEMQLELKEMHRQLGITFIYVTHDQEEALTMSDKIVVMNEGRILQIGAPEDIYNEPASAFVADFIGESNIFNGIMTGKLKARFCGGDFECVDDYAVGTHITAILRPEDVILTPPGEGIISGTVSSVIFKGIHYEIVVESGRNEMVIQSTKNAVVGEKVGMTIDPDNIHIIVAEDHTNRFLAGLDKNFNLEFNDHTIDADPAMVLKGWSRSADGALLNPRGDEIAPEKIRITVAIEPEDIKMSDEAGSGLVDGYISDLIYKGDHYSYVIRTELGHDFIVDDEYLWNMDDAVSLIMPVEKMRFTVGKH